VAHYPAPLAWMLMLLAGYEVQSWISPRNRYSVAAFEGSVTRAHSGSPPHAP
jgi:hypothetical protein